MSELPVLVYDGDCGFCTRSARFAGRLSARVRVRPWQDTDLAALGTSESRARREVLFIGEDHRVSGGAAAAAELLKRSGGAWRLAGRALTAPVVRDLAERVYRVVAANRYRLPGSTPACRLPEDRRPGG